MYSLHKSPCRAHLGSALGTDSLSWQHKVGMKCQADIDAQMQSAKPWGPAREDCIVPEASHSLGEMLPRAGEPKMKVFTLQKLMPDKLSLYSVSWMNKN